MGTLSRARSAGNANMPVAGKEEDKDRPCLKWLCMAYADDRNAGLLLYFVLGWQTHAKLHRKGKAGRWIAVSRADILARTGMSLKQYNTGRKRLQTLEGVHLVGGGFRGKRSLFMQCTDRLERFLRRGYASKSAARKAMEAFRQEAQQQAVDPTGITQARPTGAIQSGPTGPISGHYPGNNEGHNKGNNPIQSTHSTLSTLSAHEESGVLEEKAGKEKPGMNGEGGEIDQMDQIVPEKSQTSAPPGAKPAPSSPNLRKPPGAKAPSLEPSAELLDGDDQDLLEQSKQLTLKKLEKDLELYPELPIPKGCPLVHPAKKAPERWASFSHKVKADLYARFLEYLDNWKASKVGKHAASVYGSGKVILGLGMGTSGAAYAALTEDEENDPDWAETSAQIASWDEDEA
jgi:hypothetical protein